jgi:hypothetical protein
MTEIEWREPPNVTVGGDYRKGVSKYDLFAAQLRERPGMWAVIITGARSANTTFAKKKFGAAFEVTSRKVSPDNHDIYARYVGGES